MSSSLLPAGVDLGALPDLRPKKTPAVLAEGLDVAPCRVTIDGDVRPALAVTVTTVDGRVSAPFLFHPDFDWAGFAGAAADAAAELTVAPVEVVPPPVPAKVTCPGCGVAIFGDRAAAGVCGACE